jgi:hypothetical protein
MSFHTPICYCCYDREEEYDDEMDLPDYDDESPREMIELWLDVMKDGVDGVLRPLSTYIKGGGADELAKSPDLRARVIAETRLYIMAKPSEENRAARMEIYNSIRAMRAHNLNWVE